MCNAIESYYTCQIGLHPDEHGTLCVQKGLEQIIYMKITMSHYYLWDKELLSEVF